MDLTTIDYSSFALNGAVDSYITTGGVIALSVFIVAAIVNVQRFRGRVFPIFAGLVAYLAFAMAIPSIFTALMSGNANAAYTMAERPQMMAFASVLLEAVFGTLGMWFVLKGLNERFQRKGDMYFTAWGYSLGALLLFGFSSFFNYTMVLGIKTNGIEEFARQMTENASESEVIDLVKNVTTLSHAVPLYWIALGVVIGLEFVFICEIMALILGAVRGELGKVWIFVSGVAYFVFLLPIQLVDSGSVAQIIVALVIDVIVTVAAGAFAFNLFADRLQYEEAPKKERKRR